MNRGLKKIQRLISLEISRTRDLIESGFEGAKRMGSLLLPEVKSRDSREAEASHPRKPPTVGNHNGQCYYSSL
jgi:hypothetical protein